MTMQKNLVLLAVIATVIIGIGFFYFFTHRPKKPVSTALPANLPAHNQQTAATGSPSSTSALDANDNLDQALQDLDSLP